VLIKKAEERPSMAKVDGLWVHQGIPQAGANWEHLLEEIREERCDKKSGGTSLHFQPDRVQAISAAWLAKDIMRALIAEERRERNEDTEK
jgi:hypothetical protein